MLFLPSLHAIYKFNTETVRLCYRRHNANFLRNCPKNKRLVQTRWTKKQQFHNLENRTSSSFRVLIPNFILWKSEEFVLKAWSNAVFSSSFNNINCGFDVRARFCTETDFTSDFATDFTTNFQPIFKKKIPTDFQPNLFITMNLLKLTSVEQVKKLKKKRGLSSLRVYRLQDSATFRRMAA